MGLKYLLKVAPTYLCSSTMAVSVHKCVRFSYSTLFKSESLESLDSVISAKSENLTLNHFHTEDSLGSDPDLSDLHLSVESQSVSIGDKFNNSCNINHHIYIISLLL